MLHTNVITGTMPEPVVVEELPDGGRRLVMSKDFAPFESEDGTGYVGSQADCLLPAGREETVKEITAESDAWWEYAAGYDPTKADPSLEERVADIEEAVLALLGM